MMLNLLLYEAKVALLLALFYICYRVLLCRETLHRLNRIVLTGSVLISFLLPFCVLTFHRTVEVVAGAGMTDLSAVLPDLPQETTALAEPVQTAAATGDWWPLVLVVLYAAGIAGFLVRMAVELVKVSRIIRSGEKHLLEDGTTLVVVDRDIAPFSWMNWIVVSRQDCGNNHIIKHERAHIRLGHARDLLFINILSSMQWFNPVMRMLKDDLRAVYEYEADDAVLREGANIKEYQYSLIRKAVSASGYSITNSFNHSILKNRITMMSKQKSVTWRGLRALYVLPLIGAVLACNAQTVTDYKVSENSVSEQTGDIFVPQQKGVNLEVRQEGGAVAYYVNGEKVGLDAIGRKVIEAQNEEMTFYYVNLIGSPDVQLGAIQDVKNELRKVGALRIQYVCEPKVEVQRKLTPTEPGKGLADFMEYSKEGDVQIRLNSLDKLLYIGPDGQREMKAINQGDLFDLAKKDIEKNNGITFFFIADNGSSFGAYSSAVQDVHDAFVAVREDLARQKYGKAFDELEEAKQDELRQQCSVRVYESGK